MTNPRDTGRRAASYRYHDARIPHTHAYLWPTAMRVIDAAFRGVQSRRVFEIGCGNGAFAAALAARGYDVTGIDPSIDGIRIARSMHSRVRACCGSTEDNDLPNRFGSFGVVVSLEVIEHVYDPRRFAAAAYDLLDRGGTAVISTPYHGYVKNVALALSGKLDSHFTALWDHGHIKFWSRRTLTELLREAGFDCPTFYRVGRIPQLAKSMIAVAKRPVLS